MSRLTLSKALSITTKSSLYLLYENAVMSPVALMVPVTLTAADEVIPAADRVPVDVRWRPCAVPETTRSVPVTVDDEEMVPVTFTAADEVIPAAERVPVMSAGPPTTRLAVASTLETEMVPPERRLLTVKFDVAILDALRVPVML